jgi:hypothetical protein
MKKFLLGIIITLVSGTFTLAQNYNIDAVDGTTINDCTITLFDSGGSGGDYSASENYTVTICSGTTDLIEVSFVSMNIETTYDDITIYEGVGTGGTVLGSFDGSTLPGNITSTTTCITIAFNSDGSVQYDGFELTTSCVSPPCNPANVNVTQTCAGDNSSYDLEVDVTSLVDASSVDIIIGGTTEESSVGVGTYTYTGLTAGTTVEVVDDSDPTCSYTETITMCSSDYNIDAVDGTTLTGCSYTIFDSGGDTGDYANSENYTVTICSGSAQFLQVSFASFYTESIDDLNIYDGTGTGGTLLGSFSGSTIPSDLITTSTCITIEFDSDGSIVYDGFELSVSCICTPANVAVTQTCAGDNSSYDLEVDVTSLVDASSVDIIIGGTTEESSVGVGTYTYTGLTAGTTVEVVDDSDPTCTYSETVIMCSNDYNIDVVDGTTLTGCNYTIYDSGGAAGDYANSENYTVTICSGSAEFVQVSFTSFNTESIDDLNIYDGTGTGGTLLGSFSGSTIPGDLASTSSCLTIEFISDGSVVYDGFEILTSCLCNPASANITQTCAGDNLSYDLEVEITAMLDASNVDIIIGGTTEESSVGVGTYTYTGLTSGTTVEVVDDSDPTCVYTEVVQMCDLCIIPTAPSDECAGAPLIDLSQPFEGSTDCSYTASVGNPENCGSIENDSWISFIAGSTDVEMDYTIGDCDPNGDGVQLSVFSGTCGSLVDLPGSCVNPTGENVTGTWNFTGLTVGDTYYIRIDGYAGDLCDYYFEPVSGVVITPPNNACDDAIALNCGDSDIASNILADAVDSPTGCAGGGTPGDGVWYSFIGDGSEVTISTDNPGTNFDTEINIFEGPCTSLTCIGGDNDGGVGMTSSYTFNTTNGTEYFIFVDGDGTAAGQFEVNLDCTTAPPCDADAGAWD